MKLDRPDIDLKRYPKWIRPHPVGGNTYDHAWTIASVAIHNSESPSPKRYKIVDRLAYHHGKRIKNLPGADAVTEIGFIALAGRLSAMSIAARIREISPHGEDDALADTLDNLNRIIWPLIGSGPPKQRLKILQLVREAHRHIQLWDGAMLHPGYKSLLNLGTVDAPTFGISLHNLLRDTGRYEARHRSPRLADALDNLNSTL